ncbi:photosystem reaction center subunit H [Rhizobium rhizosphaerae]|uniref:Photosystem reaction center subunit H n=1 Tax=Xaviernesmea rhizosphaerae TaxID=1672749 RepID=A0A1Q9AH68_9HYPH|nr:PRC-barrel domain-containing protein [Xaviernesmea rhizosphaerae]OLP54530.1 photosystem reaction center subunit H [Xaviernesmea rhizosphaerae]OQP85953.1 photosystem reaction center subunit H [Xaviernesmea rhizosphaerae]
MTKKLTASVAAGALFAGLVAFAPASFAQDAAQPAQPNAMQPAPMTNDATTGQMGDNAAKPLAGQAADAGAKTGNYITEQGANQVSANRYIGQSVYNSNDESIGEINDVIFSTDGSVEAAVIGVGGFLGIGEKNVAVPLETITIAEVPNSNDMKLTTQETSDSLRNAPEFKTRSQQMAESNNGNVDASTTSSTAAPAGGAAPAPAAPATNN